MIPNNPSLVNYDDLINHPSFPFETWLWNSIKITVIAVTLTVTLTVLAGYALSRFRFAGKRAFMTGILVLNVFPAVLSIIALFGMMQQLGTQISWLGLDSHGGLIVIYVSFGMGINVLLVKRVHRPPAARARRVGADRRGEPRAGVPLDRASR